MKLLCTGDLHIGRRSSKVLDEHEARRHSAAAVWESIVELALRESVDVVALTGDVVDRDNRYFEALGPLERGIARLTTAGIDVVAVSGNHDFDVLPRLVDSVGSDRLRLLGRGGVWEQITIERPNGALRVQGWSFPEEHWPQSPLASYDLGPARGDAFAARTPTVVLLHSDLDNLASRYAPVALAEILRLPIDACLLGHIHRPLWRNAEHGPALLYPGSPQALDPGETGPHGPWILEFTGTRDVRARQVPLSRIRYEVLEVDLDGATESSEVETRLGAAVREILAEVAVSSSAVELLSLRLEFTGRTSLHHRLPRELPALLADYAPSDGALRAQIEQSIFRTRPSFELAELARASDAPGALARLMIDLDAGRADAECERLAAQAHLRLHEVHHASAFEPVMADSPPDLAAARAVLRQSAAALLDELLAQKESA